MESGYRGFDGKCGGFGGSGSMVRVYCGSGGCVNIGGGGKVNKSGIVIIVNMNDNGTGDGDVERSDV